MDDYTLDHMDVSESSVSSLDITNVSLDEDDSVFRSFTADIGESLLNSSITSTSTTADSVESILNSSSTSASCSSDETFFESAPKRQNDQQYLYNSSKLTVFESYLLIMKYSLRHGLTKRAIGDLLDLVGMHLPEFSMISVYRYIHGICI